MSRRSICNGAVTIDPQVMSGAPVFANTRVPVKNLFDYLASGSTLEEFLKAFDWVERKHAEEVLRSAYRKTFESDHAA